MLLRGVTKIITERGRELLEWGGGGGGRRDHFANDISRAIVIIIVWPQSVFMGFKGEHFIFCRM